MSATDRTRARRHPERGQYDRETIDAILDEALYCHLGFVVDDQPYVIPTLHARVGDLLYVHGSSASRMLRHAASGAPMCATVTLIDGLVLAKSVFNHSVNYRSVVVLGEARQVDDEEKLDAFHAFTERVAPGRWEEARQPTATELKATSILSLPSPRPPRKSGAARRRTSRRTKACRSGTASSRSISPPSRRSTTGAASVPVA